MDFANTGAVDGSALLLGKGKARSILAQPSLQMESFPIQLGGQMPLQTVQRDNPIVNSGGCTSTPFDQNFYDFAEGIGGNFSNMQQNDFEYL